MKRLTALFLGSTFLLLSALMAQPPASVGYYSTPPAGVSNSINWYRNYSDAVATSQSTSKPILILFTGTNWCPACMKLERQVLTRPEFSQAVGQRFVFLKAEFPDYSEDAVLRSPYKPLLDRYNVDAFPTMVIVNANGQKLYTVNYRDGGPQAYTQELLQKLNMNRGM